MGELCGEGAHTEKREAGSGNPDSNLGEVNSVSRGVTVMQNTAIGETTEWLLRNLFLLGRCDVFSVLGSLLDLHRHCPERHLFIQR